MKKILIMLTLAVLCCSCKIDDGHSRHTSGNLKEYSSLILYDYVLEPVEYINAMLQLDDYLKASEEERLSERFDYINDGLVKPGKDTYRLYYYPEINTAGKSFRDPEAQWQMENILFETLSEDTWHVSEINGKKTDVTLRNVDTAHDGSYVFEVDAIASSTAIVSSSNGHKTTVTNIAATLTMPEGPITLGSNNDSWGGGKYNTIPYLNGAGMIRVDFTSDGHFLDWVEMKLIPSGKNEIVYKTSLD